MLPPDDAVGHAGEDGGRRAVQLRLGHPIEYQIGLAATKDLSRGERPSRARGEPGADVRRESPRHESRLAAAHPATAPARRTQARAHAPPRTLPSSAICSISSAPPRRCPHGTVTRMRIGWGDWSSPFGFLASRSPLEVIRRSRDGVAHRSRNAHRQGTRPSAGAHGIGPATLA